MFNGDFPCIKDSVYIDEGVSGTSMAKRDGLLRLLEDCDTGLIDYIIVKSISRFSRNTVDSIETVRRLIEKITVYDEKLTVEFKSGLEIDVDA